MGGVPPDGGVQETCIALLLLGVRFALTCVGQLGAVVKIIQIILVPNRFCGMLHISVIVYKVSTLSYAITQITDYLLN